VRLPRAPPLRLIFSQWDVVCNRPTCTTKASDVLNLLTILPPSLEEPAIKILERDWHQDVMVMLRERLPKVLVVLFFLFLVQQIIKFLVKRMQRLALRHTGHALRGAQLRTMATIIRATSYSVLGFLAFLQILNLLNINYAPLLASAGILGVGIGLGAQSLFKDIINGIFILVEDQYNVGEVVKVASLTGTVEDLTLRLTRLRDGDGTLYVIPNSQIATVSNLSRDFAVASLPVAIDASANPDRVIALLKEIAASVRSDPAFKDVVLEEPNVLGVDKIDGRSIVYPVNLRVRPNQKDGVLRELRRRIVIGFEENGIPLGSDSSLLIMQQAKDPTAPPSQQPIVGS
jgi:small-conductance mechanosensitive channel